MLFSLMFLRLFQKPFYITRRKDKKKDLIVPHFFFIIHKNDNKKKGMSTGTRLGYYAFLS